MVVRPGVSLFDQAADTLREAMEGQVSAIQRARLIHDALELYHRHRMEEVEEGPGIGGPEVSTTLGEHA